jgi:hypothetical protein
VVAEAGKCCSCDGVDQHAERSCSAASFPIQRWRPTNFYMTEQSLEKRSDELLLDQSGVVQSHTEVAGGA